MSFNFYRKGAQVATLSWNELRSGFLLALLNYGNVSLEVPIYESFLGKSTSSLPPSPLNLHPSSPLSGKSPFFLFSLIP